MSSTKTILQQGGWRSWSAQSVVTLIALMLAFSTIPQAVRAGELEYQECIRQLCTSYGKDEYSCVETCVSELHGPSKTIPQAPVPILYGAIAVETGSLITGYAKGYSSRAAAESRAIAMCRRAGGWPRDARSPSGAIIAASRLRQAEQIKEVKTVWAMPGLTMVGYLGGRPLTHAETMAVPTAR